MRAVALLATLALGCESVPSLTFAQPDAAPTDGRVSDGSSDGAEPDGADGGCNPDALPPPATSCCPVNDVPCAGDCTAQCGFCGGCAMFPGTYCCALTNMVRCLPIGMQCR